MAIHDTLETVADGDQLNEGYFNGIVVVKNMAGTALKNSLNNNINKGKFLLKIVPTSNATSITIDDLDTDYGYDFYEIIIDNTHSAINLTINDYAANYYGSKLSVNGSTLTGSNFNSAYFDLRADTEDITFLRIGKNDLNKTSNAGLFLTGVGIRTDNSPQYIYNGGIKYSSTYGSLTSIEKIKLSGSIWTDSTILLYGGNYDN